MRGEVCDSACVCVRTTARWRVDAVADGLRNDYLLPLFVYSYCWYTCTSPASRERFPDEKVAGNSCNRGPEEFSSRGRLLGGKHLLNKRNEKRRPARRLWCQTLVFDFKKINSHTFRLERAPRRVDDRFTARTSVLVVAVVFFFYWPSIVLRSRVLRRCSETSIGQF